MTQEQAKEIEALKAEVARLKRNQERQGRILVRNQEQLETLRRLILSYGNDNN